MRVNEQERTNEEEDRSDHARRSLRGDEAQDHRENEHDGIDQRKERLRKKDIGDIADTEAKRQHAAQRLQAIFDLLMLREKMLHNNTSPRSR